MKLALLPANATILYFVVSAYTTTLQDILQPSVHLHDADSGAELCAYELDSFKVTAKGKTAAKSDKASVDEEPTAVVMCRLSKDAAGKWQLSAIGSLGQGRASDYAPIHRDIKAKQL